MKGKQLLAALLASACMLAASGCAAKSASVENLMKDTKKEQTESLYDTTVVQDTATALTGFGIKLLQNAMVEANPLVSPLSVASALSMTVNGALGETKTQMEQALGADTGSLNAYFSVLQAYLKDNQQMKLANSIWMKDTDTLHIEDAFLQQRLLQNIDRTREIRADPGPLQHGSQGPDIAFVRIRDRNLAPSCAASHKLLNHTCCQFARVRGRIRL